MKRFLTIIIGVVLLVSCNNNEKNNTANNIKNTNVTNEQPLNRQSSQTVQVNENNSVQNEQIINHTPQLPYELKEDGIYVYVDGPYKTRKIDTYCYEYTLKNYSYNKIESQKNKIESAEGSKKYQICSVPISCKTNLGKPTLYELGYERHKEREIKPEDNRFGKSKNIEKTRKIQEKRILEEVNYQYLLDEHAIQITKKEFIKNGIVIIGKHISRVVIKSLKKLPKYGNKILVKYEKIRYKCNGAVSKRNILEPKVIADFKRINLKENIFEFIKNQPLPETADYLSDGEFIRLSENIHQFIPRINDMTIHNKANYTSGYYLIEYYNGNVLYDYHCIKLGNPGKPTPYWDKLNFNSPVQDYYDTPEQKFALILAECNTVSEATHFINQKDAFPLVILPFRNNGKVLVGKMFYSEISGKNEMQRYINMGINKNTMQLLPF